MTPETNETWGVAIPLLIVNALVISMGIIVVRMEHESWRIATKNDINKIRQISGVEHLSILSQYRFVIYVGNYFETNKVKTDIDNLYDGIVYWKIVESNNNKFKHGNLLLGQANFRFTNRTKRISMNRTLKDVL